MIYSVILSIDSRIFCRHCIIFSVCVLPLCVCLLKDAFIWWSFWQLIVRWWLRPRNARIQRERCWGAAVSGSQALGFGCWGCPCCPQWLLLVSVQPDIVPGTWRIYFDFSSILLSFWLPLFFCYTRNYALCAIQFDVVWFIDYIIYPC